MPITKFFHSDLPEEGHSVEGLPYIPRKDEVVCLNGKMYVATTVSHVVNDGYSAVEPPYVCIVNLLKVDEYKKMVSESFTRG